MFYCFVLLQAKALVEPFAYDAYIEERKREKLENERVSRITVSYFHLIFEYFIKYNCSCFAYYYQFNI